MAYTAKRIVRPDTAFSLDPSRGRKRPREHSDNHLKFIRALPCAICGSRINVHAAHVRSGSPQFGKRKTGIGEKPHDRWTVPLCAEHHLTGDDAQHDSGEMAWWSKHGINPFVLASALWSATGDEEAGDLIIKLRALKAEE